MFGADRTLEIGPNNLFSTLNSCMDAFRQLTRMTLPPGDNLGDFPYVVSYTLPSSIKSSQPSCSSLHTLIRVSFKVLLKRSIKPLVWGGKQMKCDARLFD